MKVRFVWAAVALLAIGAGLGLWWMGQPPPRVGPASIAGAALYAMSFRDEQGASQALGRFQGRVLVINFWATWCAPCRDEMPALERVSERWSRRDVTFVGLSQEPRELATRFGREMHIGYPLWTGGDEVAELARRLGNRIDALPFTAIVDRSGHVAVAKVGPYTEAELESALAQIR